jgi:hypothetical protein
MGHAVDPQRYSIVTFSAVRRGSRHQAFDCGIALLHYALKVTAKGTAALKPLSEDPL